MSFVQVYAIKHFKHKPHLVEFVAYVCDHGPLKSFQIIYSIYIYLRYSVMIAKTRVVALYK